jgi:hypothetical protein
LRRASGTVRFHDHDLTAADEAGLTRYRREQVGFVFQFYNLIPSLTARECSGSSLSKYTPAKARGQWSSCWIGALPPATGSAWAGSSSARAGHALMASDWENPATGPTKPASRSGALVLNLGIGARPF